MVPHIRGVLHRPVDLNMMQRFMKRFRFMLKCFFRFVVYFTAP